ncbi:MAG: hypothetical protein ABI282_04965 [Candidatus Baltobacteraceae bacterium]
MIHRIVRAMALLLVLATVAASGDMALTGQLLAYQDGFVFFTNGAGFRVAPGVKILDIATKGPSADLPRPRIYARAVFDSAGAVTELDLSRAPLPIEPLSDAIAKYSVQQSPSYPNPDLIPKPSDLKGAPNAGSIAGSGRPVLVVITVQVPVLTPPAAGVYITTDTSGWNPQAIQMDRIDALHFRITRRIASGTILRYLYTRGALQSEERAANGLDRSPRLLAVTDADVRAVNDTVYNWADTLTGSQSVQPNTIPTPYNPAPFPNLPTGMPTPHPARR